MSKRIKENPIVQSVVAHGKNFEFFKVTLTDWIHLNCNTIKCLIFDLKLVFQYLAKLSSPIPLEFYECFDVNTDI